MFDSESGTSYHAEDGVDLRVKRRTPIRTTPLGRDLISSAKEILHSLHTGDTSKMIIRRAEVPDPHEYAPRDVKALRARLNTSQSLFARLMGVSTDLVAHWEHGIRKPAPMACRLMDKIQEDPDGFVQSLVKYG